MHSKFAFSLRYARIDPRFQLFVQSVTILLAPTICEQQFLIGVIVNGETVTFREKICVSVKM